MDQKTANPSVPETPATQPTASAAPSTVSVAELTSAVHYAGVDEEETPQSISVGIDHARENAAEVQIVESKESIYKSAKSFQELGLSANLLKGVLDMGFIQPSRIQGEALPRILARDTAGNFKRVNLIGQAQHGSGKTATYSLSMLSLVDESKRFTQALCIVPTRELALQVHSVLTKLAKHTQLTAYLAVKDQARVDSISEHIIIGTPGSVMGHVRGRRCDGKKVRVIVLDEADHMLSKDGHGEECMTLRKSLSPDVQVLLFSATFGPQTDQFATAFARGPPGREVSRITIKKEELSLATVKQFFIVVPDFDQRYAVLKQMFALMTIGQTIIFAQTVATVKALTNDMRRDGYAVSLLHGQMQPDERDAVMSDFRSNKTTVLITTNVLSRGIDVLAVNLVINFDMPTQRNGSADPDTYIHRIGRSGRFGRRGVAINFACDESSFRIVKLMEHFFKSPIEQLQTDDIEAMSKTVEKYLKA